MVQLTCKHFCGLVSFDKIFCFVFVRRWFLVCIHAPRHRTQTHTPIHLAVHTLRHWIVCWFVQRQWTLQLWSQINLFTQTHGHGQRPAAQCAYRRKRFYFYLCKLLCVFFRFSLKHLSQIYTIDKHFILATQANRLNQNARSHLPQNTIHWVKVTMKICCKYVQIPPLLMLMNLQTLFLR